MCASSGHELRRQKVLLVEGLTTFWSAAYDFSSQISLAPDRGLDFSDKTDVQSHRLLAVGNLYAVTLFSSGRRLSPRRRRNASPESTGA